MLRRFDGLIGVNPEIISFFQRLGVAPERTRLIYPHSFLTRRKLPDLAGTLYLLFQRAQSCVDFSRPAGTRVRSSSADRSPGTSPAKVSVSRIVVNWIGKPGSRICAAKSHACTYAEHILLCGDVPHAITMAAISQADVMLRTTLFDGDAVSVREALHLGTPVIASDNGMRPDGVHLIPKSNLAGASAGDRRNAGTTHGRAGKQIAAPTKAMCRQYLIFIEELTGENDGLDVPTPPKVDLDPRQVARDQQFVPAVSSPSDKVCCRNICGKWLACASGWRDPSAADRCAANSYPSSFNVPPTKPFKHREILGSVTCFPAPGGIEFFRRSLLRTKCWER